MSEEAKQQPQKSAYEKLSAKRRVFVDAYLRLWNGAAAAREADYANPDRQAYRLLRNVEIQTAIQERLDELKMSADEVLLGLAQQARFDPLQFAVFNDGYIRIDLKKIKTNGLGQCVKKISYDRDGRVVVEFHDAQRARELIGRHHRLFVNRNENIDLDFSQLTDEQLERIAAGEDPFEVVISTASRGRT